VELITLFIALAWILLILATMAVFFIERQKNSVVPVSYASQSAADVRKDMEKRVAAGECKGARVENTWVNYDDQKSLNAYMASIDITFDISQEQQAREHDSNQSVIAIMQEYDAWSKHG